MIRRSTMMNLLNGSSMRAGFAALAWLASATLSTAARAETIDVFLCAGSVSQTMPDGRRVPMWGYARVSSAAELGPGCGAAATVPGPPIELPPAGGSPGPTTLQVHLYNDGIPEGISIVVPGQTTKLEPVRNPDGRVRSFTAEAAAGTVTTYTWPNFSPGTYAYQSGSHPAVQVQMGLYGAITRDAAPDLAYPGVPYAHDVVLLYSEIDPELHDAVASGRYGSPPFTSTIDYRPRYHLVNGEAHVPSVTPPIAAGTAGRATLLRLLNLGLESHAPTFLGGHLALVAEDGHAYPNGREQYSVLLAAGKTRDAVWVPASSGRYVIYDRRFRLESGAGLFGGMLAELEIGAAVEAGSTQPARGVPEPAVTAGAR
jgi:FtsP/CotA-like multicopper oxidase with cupredoxin domain